MAIQNLKNKICKRREHNLNNVSSLIAYSLIGIFFSGSLCFASSVSQSKSCHKIEHTVVIYLENHSFYNLFANFPGADNAFPEGYKGQITLEEKLYATLPPVTERNKPDQIDKRFPKDLPNKEFAIDQYSKINERIPDPIHEFFSHIYQLHDGKLDRFVSQSGVGALTMGYYDMKGSNLWKYAEQNTLADHFFQSSFGGSFINHQWLIAGRTPKFENAPEKIRIKLYPDGRVQQQGLVTEDGYAVNTLQPLEPPFDPKVSDKSLRLPPLEYDNIGDRLNEKKISWAWYSGGWNAIQKGEPVEEFQYHHQPFLYFKKYGPNTEGRKNHLKDESELLTQISQNKLPAVVLYKPVGPENAHPGYSNVDSGDTKTKLIIDAIEKSKLAKNTFVIITFDEHGGFWDPKAPPKVDRFGPGSRIPAIFISPNLKGGIVDHTQYETTSIMAGLEKKYKLRKLLDRKPNPVEIDACTQK